MSTIDIRFAELFDAAREVAARVSYDDGNAIVGALDMELLERKVHNLDISYLPSRPDSAVDPCWHHCEHCKKHDTPSGWIAKGGPTVEVKVYHGKKTSAVLIDGGIAHDLLTPQEAEDIATVIESGVNPDWDDVEPALKRLVVKKVFIEAQP